MEEQLSIFGFKENFYEENMEVLKANAKEFPFETRPTACLFRLKGKPMVDFYPHTGRWRIVGGSKKRYPKSGGAGAFLDWYGYQGAEGIWEFEQDKRYSIKLSTLLKDEDICPPDICPECLNKYDKTKPLIIQKDENGKILFWEYEHTCKARLRIYNDKK